MVPAHRAYGLSDFSTFFYTLHHKFFTNRLTSNQELPLISLKFLSVEGASHYIAGGRDLGSNLDVSEIRVGWTTVKPRINLGYFAVGYLVDLSRSDTSGRLQVNLRLTCGQHVAGVCLPFTVVLPRIQG
jgi:hypothetical protein